MPAGRNRWTMVNVIFECLVNAKIVTRRVLFFRGIKRKSYICVQYIIIQKRLRVLNRPPSSIIIRPGRGDGGGGEKSARNFCRRGKRTGAKRCAENELAYLPYFIVNIRERGKGTERNDETDYGEIV